MDRKRNTFDSAADVTGERLSRYLRALPQALKNQIQEIRLRSDRPVCLCTGTGVLFLHKEGIPGRTANSESLAVFREEIEEIFRRVCRYSVYSHQNEIKNGYVTILGGHRVGICGTMVYSGGEISGIREISSLNIRIAREIKGCADTLIGRIGGELTGGLLIAGPPACGKTTLLRDLARQISEGICGDTRKVVVIDERGEIAASCGGVPQNDLGPCCDVLDGCTKGDGILQAVRSLSPDFIICDELGGEQDAASVTEGLNAGAAVVATIHAGNPRELLGRRQARRLLETGAFRTVVFLEGRSGPGRIREIWKAGDLLAEMDGSDPAAGGVRDGGVCGIA